MSKIKVSASERVSNMYFTNYDYNKIFRLYKFQLGYRKFHLNTVITSCFWTPPIFHRNNYFLAPKTCFTDTLCFQTPPIFHRNNYF